MTLGPLSALVIAWTAGFVSASARAIEGATYRSAEPVTGTPRTGRMLVARAVSGHEPTLARALGSIRDATISGDWCLRIAVESTSDGAYPVARDACEALAGAGIDARVIVTGARGPNRKADQLARVLAAEITPFDVVVVADGCVDLSGTDLDQLVAPLASSTVGACWAAPIEVAPTTAADRASAAILDASLHAFSLLAPLDPRGMVGKLFALRASTLARTGGLGELVAFLGEDMELARRLDALGLEVRLCPVRARSLAGGRSFGEVIARYARWMMVIRGQRPHLLASYPLLFCATPLLSCLAIAAALVEGPVALLAAAIAIAARLAVAVAAKRASGRPLTPALVVDAAIADAILFFAFVRALGSRSFSWRGQTLRLGRDGRLATARAGEPSSRLAVAARGRE